MRAPGGLPPITTPPVEIGLILPEVIVLATALVVLVADLWVGPRRRGWLVGLSLAGLAWAAWAALSASPGVGFAGMYVRDALTCAGDLLALGATALGLLVAPGYLKRHGLDRGEYYFLVMIAGTGAMLMAASRDLLMLFLSIETLSIPLYVLAAFRRGFARSQEAGMKYFLLSTFASAFLLYGIALLYGTTGTTRMPELGARLAELPWSASGSAGAALVTIGVGFKAALVPFHAWAPDVYDGAPIPSVAFMAVIAKVGAFLALVRIFPLTLGSTAGEWTVALGVVASMTMVVGNLAALLQSSYKRMLAYSSIAHAGYLLVGVATGTAQATSAVLTYLAVYVAMGTGAFAVAVAVEREGDEADRIEDYAGLAARAPLLAAATALFMVSLAGLPPTGGFVAKFGVFAAAVEGGGPGGLALALLGVLTSVISVYYYLRVVYVIYSVGEGDPPQGVRVLPCRMLGVALAVAVAAVIQVGVLPATVTSFSGRVVELFR